MSIAGKYCPLCGGDGVQAKYGRECCDTLLFWEWRSESDYSDWYVGDAYHTMEQVLSNRLATQQRDVEHMTAALSRLALMQAMDIKPGTLLDVGAGMGAFVAVASMMGYQATGTDPCLTMVGKAKALGRNVDIGGWEQLDTIRMQFEVVTCHDVLEHLVHPVEALAAMKQRIAPGGVLIVEMPEFMCPFGDWVRHIKAYEHVALYSESSARTLFERCGLTVEAVTRPKRGALGKIVYWLRHD